MKTNISLRIVITLIILLILPPCYGQSPLPDRVVLSWMDDPSTSQAVTWRTDTSVVRAVAQIDLADANGHELRGDTLLAETSVFNSDLGKSYYHRINFTGLLPDKLYAYRVGDGVNWSEWSHFRTASQSIKPFSFVYFGDAQDDIRSLCSRVFREAYRAVPQAAFTLHAGDLINRAYRDAEWGEWFQALSWINATVPVVAAIGNHEYMRLPAKVRKIDPHWTTQFSFPRNGPEGFENTCYYIDYQGSRIIVLNSFEEHEKQARWLSDILRDSTPQWTIVTFHYPVYSPRDRNYDVLLKWWKPLFDKYGVDLVLTGHDHTYARMRDQAQGPVYVVSTCGPKLREVIRSPQLTRAGDHIQLYQKIKVDPSQIRFEAYLVTGELYDAFTLKKRDGQLNEVIEVLPEERISTLKEN